MKETFKMDKCVAKEKYYLKMEVYIKEILIMEEDKVMEH